MNESEIFNNFLSKNPQKGLKYSDYIKQDYNQKATNTYYKIYSWFSDDISEDFWVYSGKFKSILEVIGITNQIYYDVIVLGLTNIEDRPKCPNCGNCLTFKSMSHGYRMYCNDSCKKYYELKINGPVVLSEESKKKISNSLKQLFSSEEGLKLRKHLSIVQVNNWNDESSVFRTKEFKEKKEKAFRMLLDDPIRGKEYRKHVFEAMPIGIFNRKFKSGIYYSQRLNKNLKYLSSYEEKFLTLVEQDLDIIDFDNVRFSITYEGIDKCKHEYFPDFLVITNLSKTEFIVEIKPKFLVMDETVILKRNAAIKFCNNSNGKYKYLTLTEVELFNTNFKFTKFCI